MGVFDKYTGIDIASGFKLQAKEPPDCRFTTETISDRNALITENGAYEGMIVYVKSEKKHYKLVGTTVNDWREFSGENTAYDDTFRQDVYGGHKIDIAQNIGGFSLRFKCVTYTNDSVPSGTWTCDDLTDLYDCIMIDGVRLKRALNPVEEIRVTDSYLENNTWEVVLLISLSDKDKEAPKYSLEGYEVRQIYDVKTYPYAANVTEDILSLSIGCITIPDSGVEVGGTEQVIECENAALGAGTADNSALRTKDKSSILAAVNELADREIPIAAIDKVGGIKPYSQNGVNRSGLVVYEDGSAVVNAVSDYGLTRTGDGKVVTAEASEAEIDEGAHAYKVVTPRRLKYAFESLNLSGGSSGTAEHCTDLGDLSALETEIKSSGVAAINELLHIIQTSGEYEQGESAYVDLSHYIKFLTADKAKYAPPNSVCIVIDKDDSDINAVSYDNAVFDTTAPPVAAENWLKTTVTEAADGDKKIAIQNGRLTVLKKPDKNTTFLSE